MFTNPSAGKVLDAIREALARDVAPELTTAKAKVTLQMIDQMLTSVARRVELEQQYMADECNRMMVFLREAQAALSGVEGPAAAAFRALPESLAGIPEFAPIPPFAVLSDAYRRVSERFTEGIGYLNELVGAGEEVAPGLLQQARAYVALRIQRDMTAIFAMEGGMVGRG